MTFQTLIQETLPPNMEMPLRVISNSSSFQSTFFLSCLFSSLCFYPLLGDTYQFVPLIPLSRSPLADELLKNFSSWKENVPSIIQWWSVDYLFLAQRPACHHNEKNPCANKSNLTLGCPFQSLLEN